MKADNTELSVDKPDYSLIPPWALEEIAKVFTFGAIKHSPNDWYKGCDWSVYDAAIMRHLQAFRKGEIKDEESGRHPLSHMIVDAIILMVYDRYGIGKDDRHSVTFIEQIRAEQ